MNNKYKVSEKDYQEMLAFGMISDDLCCEYEITKVKKYPPILVARLIHDYNEGVDLNKIMSKYKIGYQAIKKILEINNIGDKERKISLKLSKMKYLNSVENDVVSDYKCGLKVCDILLKYSINHSQLSNIVKQYSLPKRSRGRKKKNK